MSCRENVNPANLASTEQNGDSSYAEVATESIVHPEAQKKVPRCKNGSALPER